MVGNKNPAHVTRSNEVAVGDACLKDSTMRMKVQMGEEGLGHTKADEGWQTAVPGKGDEVTPSPSPRTVKNSKAANVGSLGMGTVYLIVPPITTKEPA